MTDKTDIWSFLETANGTPMEPVADFYSWSLNFNAGQTPFTAFLDIIGWSQEQYGEALYKWNNVTLGYVELSKLATVLELYSTMPSHVIEFTEEILELEAEQ